MSIAYKTVQCKAEFGAARRRTGVVHRIRRIERARMNERGNAWYVATWLCGGRSIDAVFTDDPASLGSACKRCDTMLSSAVVYRCYSADGRLLYIGSCVHWSSREPLHQKVTPWWPEVARVDETPHLDLATAKRAEVMAIESEAPLYNKVHNVKRFRRNGYSFAPVAGAA